MAGEGASSPSDFLLISLTFGMMVALCVFMFGEVRTIRFLIRFIFIEFRLDKSHKSTALGTGASYPLQSSAVPYIKNFDSL